MKRIAFATLAAVSFLACSSNPGKTDGGSSSGGATSGSCVSGEQISCNCPGSSAQGVETCANGSYGACLQCPGGTSGTASAGKPTGGSASAGNSTGGSASAGNSTGGTAATTGTSASAGSTGGSSSSSSSSTGGGVSAAQACGDYATSLCNLSASCSNGWDVALNEGSVATCISLYDGNCLDRLGAVSAQTPDNIERCAELVADGGESCTEYYGNDTQCQPPAGSGATGDACAFDAQCASHFCALATQTLCGTCEPLPAAGAACSRDADCGGAQGFVCLTTGVCGPQLGDGGACGGGNDCAYGLGCLTADGGLHVCVPTENTVGATCNVYTGPLCFARGGIYCKGGTCIDLGLADAGQACGTVSGIATDCAGNGRCTSGSCVAAAADGAACNSLNGPYCQVKSTCVPTGSGTVGTCQALASSSCGITTSGGTTGGGSTGGGSTGGTGAATVLLVDNDGNTPPDGTTDTSLPIFTGWLNALGVNYVTYPEPSDDSDENDPLLNSGTYALNQYSTVIWFTGDEYGDPASVSAVQDGNLDSWLREGGKTLILFTSELVDDRGNAGIGTAETDPLLTDVGAGSAGDEDNPDYYAGSGGDVAINSQTSVAVTGAGAFSGLSWTGGLDYSTVNFYWSILGTPIATGVDTLATVQADPTDLGRNAVYPVITGNKTISGSGGASVVVWVGFTVENLEPSDPKSLSDLFTAIQSYVGTL